jgi:two-component system NarL family sensor kinase
MWMGVAATLLAGLLARRAREVERLSISRGRLVGQALDAEDRARRRLAEALHDEALQNVLAVRQMLGSARPEDRDLLVDGLDRSVKQIREAVFDLHPYLLEQAGLEAALRAVTQEAGRRAGFTATVKVGTAAAGLHDQLVFALARELVANAAKHARAAHLDVELAREPDAVVLTVADDGVGIDPAAARTAPLRGHIGLASSVERVEAIGGSLVTGPGDAGSGTRVTARLPAPARGSAAEVIRTEEAGSTAALAARSLAGPGG